MSAGLAFAEQAEAAKRDGHRSTMAQKLDVFVPENSFDKKKKSEDVAQAAKKEAKKEEEK